MEPKTILALSNDQVLLNFLQYNLECYGHRIFTARTQVQNPEKMLSRLNPDYLIIDIMMPWMDGIELCLYMRQFTPVPIMLVTSWGAGKGRIRGLDMAAEGYLTAPFDIRSLVDQMDQAVQRGHSARLPAKTTAKR